MAKKKIKQEMNLRMVVMTAKSIAVFGIVAAVFISGRFVFDTLSGITNAETITTASAFRGVDEKTLSEVENQMTEITTPRVETNGRNPFTTPVRPSPQPEPIVPDEVTAPLGETIEPTEQPST